MNPTGHPGPSIDPTAAEQLLLWWETAQRELPWRHTRDPWAVLVSEVMSQQTQIERVIPKWRDFMARYPCPTALAESPVGEVIGFWVGLGYNRRARLLHECATVVDAHHEGAIPDRLEDLLALPGVGPYTARAVLAFAFEHDVAVVDTNVGRILARLSGTTLRARVVQDLADGLVSPGSGWQWNQAILDFGAMVCTKRDPSCGGCPLLNRCAWGGTGPDPAASSAGVSVAQSRFVGSDREGRGRLVRALRDGPIECSHVSVVMGWPTDTDRAERVLFGLVNDGLVVIDDFVIRFP